MISPGKILIELSPDSCMSREDAGLDDVEEASSHLLEQAGRTGTFSAALFLCDEEEIAELHRRFMNDPTPTDVLSFPDDDGERLGDIALCPSVVTGDALRHDNPPRVEIQFCVLHGLLHLLGYDDQSQKDRRHMHEIQRDALLTRNITVKL